MEQSFTSELLLEIYDGLNRAAKVTDDEIHPELAAINSIIQSRRKAIKNFRVKNSHYRRYPNSVQKMYDTLRQNLRKKYSEKRTAVKEIMVSLSSSMRSRDFRVNFSKLHINGKDAYSCGRDASSRYCLKAISIHLRKIYKIRPASRDYINHQISNYLSDGFPYRVIRADISSFFESIPHEELNKRLTDSGLLSNHSQSLIRRMLTDYAIKSGSLAPHKGVPRGLSLSSDLAEFYMKPFDKKIREITGVVFYSRYVDDIIIIVAHDKATESNNLSSEINSACNDQELTLNVLPQKNVNKIWEKSANTNFTYLGFEHKFDSNGVSADMSQERFNRNKRRIDKCFESYHKRGNIREKEAGKWLVRRIKFLTTNTRLELSKELAHTGIYFNNSILSLPSRKLKSLDHYLGSKLNNFQLREPHRVKLYSSLKQLSFSKGFSERTYSSYTSSKGGLRASMLREITDIWKYD